VDRPKFGRLFELLLRAEIATLPAGSRITLSATLSKGTQTGERQIEVQVRDNGPYLRMPSLWFDCNSSAPAAEPPLDYGSHLLACYFTVHHHGGQIAVRRAAGKGIIYTLRFPVIPTRVEPSQCEPELLKKPRLARWLWEQLFSPDRPVQAK
jgi:hypothetical protein